LFGKRTLVNEKPHQTTSSATVLLRQIRPISKQVCGLSKIYSRDCRAFWRKQHPCLHQACLKAEGQRVALTVHMTWAQAHVDQAITSLSVKSWHFQTWAQ